MKDEKLQCFWGSWKNPSFRGGFLKKPIYIGGLPKKGGGVWTVCRSKRGAWQERGGGVFDGGLILQFKPCFVQYYSQLIEYYGMVHFNVIVSVCILVTI